MIMLRKSHFVAFLSAAAACTALLTNPLLAQPSGDGIHVTAKTIAPEAVHGQLVALSLADGIVLSSPTGDAVRIPTADLVRITSVTPPRTSRSRETVLRLAGGGVLRGRVGEGAEDIVVLQTADLGRLSLPLDVVDRLDTPQAASSAYQEYVQWFERKPRDDQDQVLLTNGDVVSGFVSSISTAGVSLEGELGETVVPYRLVVTIRFATRPPTVLEQPYMVLTLRSSGRFAATDVNWREKVVEARMGHAETVQIEAERIVQLDVVGGRWEWLGQHQPISYEHTPMLSLHWEYKADRNVLGRPLTVAGETFEHGVGVHSRSSLTYDLKDAYRHFVTHFGMDDDSGPHADVSVFILVDGKRRFAQDHVRRGQLFGPIRLDVTHAKRIELIVDFGENGDIQDRFNWVEAALIR